MRIAIIGAGAAGLMAAMEATKRGAEVTVFEQASNIGGRMRSETLDDCTIDAGAQLFGSGFSALMAVAREVGGADLLVRAPGQDALLRNGRRHAIEYGSVSSMVLSGALPMSLKLKLGAKYVPFLLRNGSMLDASDPLAAGADWLDTESVMEWGDREIGRDFVELLAYPLLGAYYGSAPERTSVAMYHSLAKAGLDVGVYAVRGGTGALMQAMANAVTSRGGRIELRTDVSQLPTGYDAFVIATPAPIASALVDDATVRSWLAHVQYSSSAVLAILLKDRLPHDWFGLSLLREDTPVRDLVAICNLSRKLPTLAPASRDVLVCLSAPATSAELIANPEAAVQRMLKALDAALPRTSEKIDRVKLYRHTHAYPVFYPGYLKHLRSFDKLTMPGRVQLAGDYLVAPTVEGALRSGQRAVDRLFSGR
jgi:oxygen-dependent protoporphyrinogen oxidase